MTGCGEVWYRAWFGTKRPRVQVPTLRPVNKRVLTEKWVLFLSADWSRTKSEGPGIEHDFCRWQRKGVLNGAEVKILRSETSNKFWAPQEVASGSRSRLPPRSVLLCYAQRCPVETFECILHLKIPVLKLKVRGYVI